ncbi:uncharacterized protein TNCV_3976761 [Trichonephila clavipes]|nr:uncharacterized protein TNCV_3976761 [Trichonephila clavipes]
MPPKRSAIGRSKKQAKRRKEERASETSDQRKTKQEKDRVDTDLARSLETNEKRQARQQRNRNHSTQTRRTIYTDLNLCGFNYNPLYNYSIHPSVIIGKMDKKCTYCGAQKFKNETPGMCCAGGKVKLPDLRSPPEPLLTLVSAVGPTFVLMDNNARPHRADIMDDYLKKRDCAYGVSSRLPPRATLIELEIALQEEWRLLNSAVVYHLIESMVRSDEAHFWTNGYVNKQNCRIWSEANPQVYVETSLHPEKLTVWCAL